MPKKDTVKKVMLFGTFDGLHPGHLDFFKQARSIAGDNAFLIVSIARDKNVFKIKNHTPHLNEKARMALLRKCELVNKVVLSGASDHLPHIIKEKPDIIALGYDQTHYVANLQKDLRNNGLKVQVKRLLPYKAHIYKNNLLRKKNTR